MKAPRPATSAACLSGKMRGDKNGERALEHVADKRRRGQILAAGAQHIGGADIAGADGADVAAAGRARDDEAERDRAEQIAERRKASAALIRIRTRCAR